MRIVNFFRGDKRMSLIKKNIASALLIKGWSCLIQFLVVPLSLNCLTKYEYGIWLTINSLLLGIDAIDVGLGNGLRNRLAQMMANGDKESARKQVSTTFFLLIIIIVPVVLLFVLFVELFDCYTLFNVDKCMIPNYELILKSSVVIMGGTFIFKFIGNMYMGLQLSAINNLLVVIGQTLSFIALTVIYILGIKDLLSVVLVYTLSPLFVYIAAYPITFYGRYSFLRPSFNTFDSNSIWIILSLSLKFFVIQITGLLLFMSSNVILSVVLSPSEVTLYQVSYRYYSLQYVLFSIVALPFWSATTDAYSKGDWKWIKDAMRKIKKLLISCAILAIVMLACSDFFFNLWVGDKVVVPFALSLLMVIYCFLLVVSNIYSIFLFGIGKIYLMVISSILSVLVFIPLQYISCMYYGIYGLVTTLIVVTIATIAVNYLQYDKLSNNKASGLWNK